MREKFGTERWQPVSRHSRQPFETMPDSGARHAEDALLRYVNHRPLAGRRYDLLWKRIRDALPWAAQYQISAHWLRHTTLSWVERHFSYAVARAYAGHTDDKRGVTLTYLRGLPQEAATALALLTGEPHPLALPTAA